MGESHLFATYIDYAAIRKTENIATAPELIDLKSEQKILGSRLMSAQTRNEYDCIKRKWRLAASTFYSRNMGKGHVVYLDKFGNKWQPVEPDSFTEVLWAIACGKAAG